MKKKSDFKIPFKIIGLVSCFSILLILMVINNYMELRDALILNEQKHLLTIVDTTSKSVENHFTAEQRSLEILTKDASFIENFKKLKNNINEYQKDELKYYYKASAPSITKIQLLELSGRVLSEYPKGLNQNKKTSPSSLNKIQKVVEEGRLQVTGAYFIDKTPYIDLLQPILENKEVIGITRVTLSIEYIYDTYIKQIRSGKKGYASIKTKDGIFLMHPDKTQIGYGAMELRKKRIPLYSWDSLRALFKEQKTGKKGSKIYKSYWVSDKDYKIVKKFNAYAPIKFQDDFWIVTLSTDYNEVVDRIKKNYYITILISGMIVLSFAMIIIYIYIIKEKKRKLEIKKSYFDKLEKLNKELEEDIQKRILLEKKLLNTMKEDKKKETLMIHQSRHAAMGEMIGNIAHQWRQPLGSLSLLISNIEDIIIYGESDMEYIEDIFKRSRVIISKMSETIDDFSNFFKPKTKKEYFNTGNLIDTVENISKERLTYNNIKFIKVADEEFEIYGYFNQLCQVILNIVNNGIDAVNSSTSSGFICIKVNDNSQEEVEITITDNGGGVPKELLEKIFDPYFSTKDEKNGTGIGLHMSKIIIEKNFNGKIKVSNNNEGANFKIIIPKRSNE